MYNIERTEKTLQEHQRDATNYRKANSIRPQAEMPVKAHEQITLSTPLLRRKGLVLTSTCRGGNQPFWTHSFKVRKATFRGESKGNHDSCPFSIMHNSYIA